MLQGVVSAAIFQSLGDRFTDPRALQKTLRDGTKDVPPAVPGEASPLRDFLGNLDTFLGTVDPKEYQDGLIGGGDSADGKARGKGGLASPVKFVDVARDETGEPRSPWDITFPSGIMWGILGCSATFAFAFVRERLSGTLLRLRVAPIHRAQLLAGKALACALACTTVMTVLLLIGRVVMGMRVASVPLLACAVLAIATCFTGIMMLLSVAGKTLHSVSGLGWGANIVMSMTGGGMIPLAFMPGWLAAVSNFSPVKWAILAMEGAIWRDFSAAEMLTPCAILVCVGVVAFGIGAWVDSRREG